MNHKEEVDSFKQEIARRKQVIKKSRDLCKEESTALAEKRAKVVKLVASNEQKNYNFSITEPPLKQDAEQTPHCLRRRLDSSFKNHDKVTNEFAEVYNDRKCKFHQFHRYIRQTLP